MGMTILEKIFASHSDKKVVTPGEIIDVKIDVRLARDFGGANVVKNLKEHKLRVDDRAKTYFTFDCNPTGSDQQYAANQHTCRLYARDHEIAVFDINSGIGTHLAIDKGLAVPGSTLVSTDSHANILGAIGAFGQGMGDRDIAAAWSRGSVWFKVPESVKITFTGKRPGNLHAKDIVLNLLKKFGANKLLGYSIELEGSEIEDLSLDERITISSMATELGAIALFIAPSEEVIAYCSDRSNKVCQKVAADEDASYINTYTFDLEQCFQAIALPGKPQDVVPVQEVQGIKIDSVFIGSCTNGRMEDMRIVAGILKGKKLAPGVVLKIVPSTDEVWNSCLDEGLIKIFKDAGALFGNAGCAGCASGQIGQNGPGEITVSTGNRNFSGKQGKGDVYLVSPAVAAASAIAGHITTPDSLPDTPSVFMASEPAPDSEINYNGTTNGFVSPTVLEGKVWIIDRDNIDTDMIYHNRHLSVIQLEEMGQYTFGNLEEWKDYAEKSEPGDIIIAGKNFGAGSSRQQAVDCFKALKNQAILAKSFGAIYERNAINAGFPVLVYEDLRSLELQQRDRISINLENGIISNLRNNKSTEIGKFSKIQLDIYKHGDLLKLKT
jgi:3-isopropylmalate/(R)-2-methylmalate dehydratase large subunit